MVFRKILLTILLLFITVFLASCGSAPSSGSSPSGVVIKPVGSSSNVFADRLIVKSDGLDNATITLLVTDVNGAPYDNLTFNVSTTLGVISASKVTTNANGMAKIYFYAPTNTPDGTAMITFSNSILSKNISLEVIGNKLDVISDKQIGKLGEKISLSISLTNTLNQPMGDKKVILNTSNGKIICGNQEGLYIEKYTDYNGKISDCYITSDNISNVVLNVRTNVGLNQIKTFYFNNRTFEFLSPVAGSNLDYKLINELIFKYLDEKGKPTNDNITFSTNKGELSNDNITFGNNVIVSPDANGNYRVYLKSTSPGEVVVKAKKGIDVETLKFYLVSKDPVNRIILNVSRNVIPISTLTQPNYTDITAVMLDSNNFPIANKTVSMSIINSGGSNGYLSDSTLLSDFDGKVTFRYYSGYTPSSYNGVQIRVVSDSVQKDVYLTVNQYAAYVSIGKGNTIDTDGEKYKKKFDILVTDISGAPIQNAVVTLSVLPLQYNDNSTGTYDTSWRDNEDINLNGILDTGEDVNSNGKLDPGNVVTLDQQTVTTDATGFASFNIMYSKCYATWVKVRIKASTQVSGTESQTYYDHILTYLLNDQFMPCKSPFAP